MSARNEYQNDWTRPAQAFRTFDGEPVMAERRKYTATDVGRAYTDGVRHGWIGAAAFYAIGTVLLILVFHFLGGAA